MISESLTTNASALSTVEAVTTKMSQLSPEQQQEVLNFVEFLAQKTAPPKSIWEKIEARIAQVPTEVLAELPADSSKNLDHYLYGAPKQ